MRIDAICYVYRQYISRSIKLRYVNHYGGYMMRIPVCGFTIKDRAGRGRGVCLSYRTAGFQTRFLHSFISVENNGACIESRIAWHIMHWKFPLTDIVDIRCRHAFPFGFTVVVYLPKAII